MSFDIPLSIEPQIVEYAQSEHITESEAILRLVQVGLSRKEEDEARIHNLLGEPMDDSDAALIDEVVETAMKARSERWKPKFIA